MRARLMMKLMGLIVMLVLTVITAHSCSGGSAASSLDPSTVSRNGLSGLCANQAAAAQASGDDSPQTLPIPADSSGLSNLAGAAGLTPGSFACPTTSVPSGVGSAGY